MAFNRYIKDLMNVDTLNPKIELVIEDYRGGFSVDPSADNRQLLEKCRKLYDALADFREKRRRARNYAFGKQWEDKIIDPDDPCHVSKISEGDYMKRQGLTPLTNNLIRKLMKSVLGVYRSNRREPMAIARDYDESQVGDMMSVAMQYAYQINECNELNARNLEEAMISGMPISAVRFRWDRERQNFEVYITNENPSRVFFNGDVQDIRMKDVRIIGFVRDYTLRELDADFAKSQEDRIRIRSYYKDVVHQFDYEVENPALDSKYTQDNTDFYICSDPSKYRVIEVWQLESKPRLRVHDLMNGTTGVAEIGDKDAIDAENIRRAEEAIKMGVDPDKVAVIRYEWFVDEFWTARFLTPNGYELLRVESPFYHLSHPYTIRCYPMVDGEIYSFVNDIIPQQRYINRYVTMMDFIRQCSAKGVLIFPKELKPKNLTEKEVAQAWTKANSVIFADVKPGSQMPQQFNAPTVNSGDTELLNIQMQLLEDISGVHAAMVGKSASASTPSSLYAQEAQNASNNLLDLIEWFDGFVRARDYKMMKTIQQFYSERRYINITGHEFSEAAKWYDPEKVRNCEMDTAISEATATPAYRMILAQTLESLLQQGLIDVKMFLQNSKLPFADRLISQIESREKEMQGGAPMAQGGGGSADMPIAPDQEEATNPSYNDKTAQAKINEALSGGVAPGAERG